MAVLVIGATCAGKSTFIDHDGWSIDDVVYGFELVARRLPQHCVIHYNLLFLLPKLRRSGRNIRTWDLLLDYGLSSALDSGRIDRAVVVTVSTGDLVKRMHHRRAASDRANPGFSPEAIASVDFVGLFHQLFEILGRYDIPFELLHSQGADERDVVFHRRETADIEALIAGEMPDPQ